MTIILNGSPRETSASTLSELLEELELNNKPIIIEHNGKALQQGSYANVDLNKEDKLELVLITAGG